MKDYTNTRREFVKASALVAGGLALPSFSIANSLGKNDSIKIALVGCGGRGTGAAKQALSTSQNVELVAMADAFQNKLDESYGKLEQVFKDNPKFNVSKKNKFVGFGAYKEAIDKADVVLLATPPGFRPQHFEYAIEHGKHVFMEKPVATDVYGVNRVLKAAEVAKQKKLNVVVGLQRHYQNKYREMMAKIHEGAIGKITSGSVYWNSPGVWVHPRTAGMTEMQYQMTNWYYFNWRCGDHILEQHIHNIDIMNWAKQAYPVKAQGMGGREVRKGKDFGQIFDHHFVEYTYADGAKMYSQCRHQPGALRRVSEELTGTNGMVNSSSGKMMDGEGKSIWRFLQMKDNNPYQTEHDELFEAIAKGEYRINDAVNGAKATMTAILGRMATYSGIEVKWDNALASNMRLVPDELSWDANPPVMPDADGNYPVPVPGVTKPW